MIDLNRGLGRIEGKLDSVEKSVEEIKSDVQELKSSVISLKSFESKVYGASAVIAVVVTLIGWAVDHIQ